MKIFWCLTLILFAAFAFNLRAPLQGIHTIRQSDTVFSAYSYCTEGTAFLKPRVAHGGTTSGIAIGEFPLYSYVLSLPCQIREDWSEYDPKLIIFIFWLLNLSVWMAWAKNYLKPKDSGFMAVLLGFSTFSLLYMTISLPDNLAFFLIGLAAFLQIRFQEDSRLWLRRGLPVFNCVLFVLAFAIRPYLIPLILLVNRRWLWMILTTSACLVIYILWYKVWSLHSELNYYYLAIPPLSEVLSTFPKYAGPLFGNILRQMFQYIFVFLVIWKWRRLKTLEVFGFFGTILLLILVRGEHLVIHGYYLWAAMVFAALCLFRAIESLPKKFQTVSLILYGIIGFAQTQHEFHGQKAKIYEDLQNLLIREQIPAEAKIAVYVGDGSCPTQYLYWMKHHGWCFYEKEFKGAEHCPQGANYYFKFNEKDEPTLRPCVSVPTDKSKDK